MQNANWQANSSSRRVREADSPESFQGSEEFGSSINANKTDWTEVQQKAQQTIRRYPIASLAGAVFAGYMIGRVLFNKD